MHIIILGLLVIYSTVYCGAQTGINDRLDCVIENITLTEAQCHDRGCVWGPVAGKLEIPNCYFDTEKYGYKLESNLSVSSSGVEANLVIKDSSKATKFVQQLDNLKFEVNYLTDRILRFRIYDPKTKRYEVPIQSNFPLLLSSPKETNEAVRQYQFNVNSNSSVFSFNITRKGTNAKIFDTSIGGLVFSDQFIQIATYLGTKNIYGFGENTHQSLRHDLNYRTWPIFTKDNFPGHHEKNLYGHHPFYTALEEDGKSHGILFLNSNAQEYSLLPYPGLSYKTIGGILDFFVFVGDNPEHVIQLYTSLIGRTFMPAFWALGFQICKYGYQNTSHVGEVVARTIKEKIPYDVQYVDSDYKHISQDFTIDNNTFGDLPEFIESTQKNNHLHWVPIIDPAIQGNDTNYKIFFDGYQQNVYVTWPKSVPLSERGNPPNVSTDRDVMYGRVWPDGPAAYPDYFKNVTQSWYSKSFSHFYNDLGWKFNGLWIDMNEPSNFNFDNCWVWHRNCYYLHCPANRFDNIPVKIKALWVHDGFVQLSNYTLCMTGVQGNDNEFQHYDVHSLYGLSMAIPTIRVLHELTGKRGFVLSRSTFVSSGRYTGHWLGDNASQWPDIKDSIIGMLEFNFFGIPYIGADICGFNGKSTADLCLRWQQLGAFYPFSRNHKENGVQFEQDPAIWAERGHPEVTEAARNALYVRYTLLPYLYTLFYKAHIYGNTVVRPLFFEYPKDNNTYNIDQQFFWGPSVLFSPFLFENQTQVDAYLPNDVWYQLNGTKFELYNKTGHVMLPDNKLHPPIHIRGGSIIPVSSEKKAANTYALRQKPIQLEVFPKMKVAFGDLFWDDGESVNSIQSEKYNLYNFELFSNCTIVIHVIKSGYSSGGQFTLQSINVANTDDSTLNGWIDDVGMQDGFEAAEAKMGSTVLTVNLDLQRKKAGESWKVSWKTTARNSCNLK